MEKTKYFKQSIWRNFITGYLSIPLFLFLLGSVGILSITTNHQPKIQIQSDKIMPPKSIVHFAFGQRELMSDLYWLRLIQDFDFCEKKIDQINCTGQGWVYHMLDLVTDLSTNFRMPLAVGPLMLTVVVSDIQGASLLFDKAVQRYPNDWSILYRASYQALIEEKNNLKAADLLRRAAQNGAPEWLYSLSARLYTESGQKEFAVGMLKQLQENSEVSPEILQRMREKIQSSSSQFKTNSNDK